MACLLICELLLCPLLPELFFVSFVFADVKVRAAVEHAIDKEQMARTLGYGFWKAVTGRSVKKAENTASGENENTILERCCRETDHIMTGLRVEVLNAC